MNDEKGFPGDDDSSEKDAADEKRRNISASRARNKTVMLTPEMTGQVRALLQDNNESAEGWKASGGNPLEDFLPPLTDWENSPEKSEEKPGRVQESGSTGKFGRPEIDDMLESGTHYGKPSGGSFDPMTSVGPPPRTGSVTRPHQVPANIHEETEHSAKQQPSFSVNRAAATSAGRSATFSGTGRAPRSPMEAGAAKQPAAAKSKIVGFLVSFDKEKTGEVFEIRAGRWLITSRPTDHGDYILVADDTVSPLHAILRATKEGKLQLLDQLSEFGTGVTRNGQDGEVEIAGSLETINHGDVVRFGKRHFVVCLIPEVAIAQASESAAE